ncbi:Ig-like domain-containing protein, partial [Vannielia sp.]|uniref:Ig-like domain-containing protein n=1 Tax=Vannielia sp. TaxID=2813045 RepID=UPI002602164F
TFTDSSLTSNDGPVTHIFELVVTDDDSAASVADSVTITITPPADTEPPVIASVADIAVDTDAGVNTASVVLTATITDNSGETILPVFSVDSTVITSPYDFPVGATTVVVDAQDSAGNDATPQTFVVTVTDTTPPQAPVVVTVVDSPDGYVDLVATAEPGSTVTITLPDGSTQNATADDGTGTFTITSDTPQQSGVITLVATDPLGNVSAPTQINFEGDDTAPTISIAALSGPTNGTYTATITLSEDSPGFDVTDLTLNNATATLTGSGSSYTATLTPTADGTVSLAVAAGTFTDAAGNSNRASNTVSAVVDASAPTVSISGAPEALAGSSSLTLTVTFSEAVTGFIAADVNATNATVTGLSGSGATYVATLRASGAGNVQVSVPADVAADAAGNGNRASNQVVIADFTVEQTQELIASYMQTRANQLIGNQPSLIPFLSGDSRGKFNFSATRGAGSFDIATGTNYPVWAQIKGSWTTDGDSESEYVFGALGGHQAIHENLLVGAMLQFDHLSEDTGNSAVSGSGWMVGPYFVAQSATQPLYFEGRLLYGETSNKISPFGTYEDSFETTRMLAQLKVAGELSNGTTTLTPFLDASYTTDDQNSYIDSLGNAIPEQGIWLGQIEVGMDFSTMMPAITGDLELWGGVSGIWSHIGGSGFASTISPDYEGGRARVELGINHQSSAGYNFTAATYYDGIGVSDYESYGLSLGYKMQF